MEKIAKPLLFLLIGFFIGIVVQSRTNGPFFRPWYDDGQIYRGDKVRFREHSLGANMYNSCKSMTLLGQQAADGNVAWILMQDCPAFPDMGPVSTDVVPQDSLIKEF